MKIARGVAGIVILLTMGCVTDIANRYYADVTYPPKEPGQVEIFYKNPQRDFTVIADFQARHTDAKYMQREAAKIGADAVIVSFLGGGHAYKDKWASENSLNTYTRISGTAIVYK